MKETGIREEAGVLGLLGLLVKSGVPLKKALEPVGVTFPNFKEPLEIIQKRLEDGQCGTEIFEGLDAYFSGFVPEIFHSGELGVSIDSTLIVASDILHSTLAVTGTGVPRYISEQDVKEVNFYRLFSIMLGNGCSLRTTLDVCSREYLPYITAAKISEVVKKGDSLEDAFKATEGFFSALGISFVSIGEQMGSLPEACELFADLKLVYLLSSWSGQEAGKNAPKSEQILKYGHLKSLILCGVPYDRALAVVFGLKAPDEQFKDCNSLADAMKSMPNEFAPWTVLLVKQAEDDFGREQALQHIIDFISWYLS